MTPRTLAILSTLALLSGCAVSAPEPKEVASPTPDAGGASCAPYARGCDLEDGGPGETIECTFQTVEEVPGWLKNPKKMGDCAAYYVLLDHGKGTGTVGYCCPPPS